LGLFLKRIRESNLIKAILFDVDGVLVDSEPVIEKAWKKVLSLYGVSLSHEVYNKFIGMTDTTFIENLAQEYKVPLSLHREEILHELYKVYCQDDLVINPINGVKEFITLAKDSHLLVALATSAPHRKLMKNLSAIGYTEKDFDCIVHGDQVQRSKPDPEIYLLAAKKLGCHIEECLVIEDSQNGVMSGHRAGATVLAFTTSLDDGILCRSGADIIESDYTSLLSFSGITEMNRMIEKRILKKKQCSC